MSPLTSDDKDKASTTAQSSSKSPTTHSSSGGGGGGSTGTAEFEPPLACVRRLLKTSLSSSTNVGKDASSAFARACGIFVIYLTACANDFARENKRQTITANDVMAAVKELDFEEFLPQLTSFLEQHRAEEKIKRKAKEAAKAAREEQEAEADDDGEAEKDENNETLEEEKPAKKRKLGEKSIGDTHSRTTPNDTVGEEDDEDADAVSEEGNDNDDDDGTHNDDNQTPQHDQGVDSDDDMEE
mmetsp:Transcript_31399/g.46877  ORF Transcript_31399/g.46877 Transcript_31399/m.46877 type:complete len:242 (-) Transcript_31399:312-1037(-)